MLRGNDHEHPLPARRHGARDRPPGRPATALLVRGRQLRDVHGAHARRPATMRVNNALTPEEVEEGWVLTCQSLPTSTSLTIEYEPL